MATSSDAAEGTAATTGKGGAPKKKKKKDSGKEGGRDIVAQVHRSMHLLRHRLNVVNRFVPTNCLPEIMGGIDLSRNSLADVRPFLSRRDVTTVAVRLTDHLVSLTTSSMSATSIVGLIDAFINIVTTEAESSNGIVQFGPGGGKDKERGVGWVGGGQRDAQGEILTLRGILEENVYVNVASFTRNV